MEESKLWQFKHQIKEEVKNLLNDDECWEMMAMLYLIMQEELFVTLLKYSNYQGSSNDLLSLIEQEDEMKFIIKTAMIEFINDAAARSSICKALVLLKDQLTHIQVLIDENEKDQQGCNTAFGSCQ